MRIAIVTIGDEILIGQVVDTNSAWMGKKLSDMGVSVVETRSIQDERNSILQTLEAFSGKVDYILMTGGLGPTKDDITKSCLAEFMNVTMEFSESTYEHIISIYTKYNIAIKPAHKEQCYMPSNAVLLSNSMGTAPGMLFEFNGTKIVSMPGVPYEMKYIMEEHVLPEIEKRVPSNNKLVSRTILTAGVGETIVEEETRKILGDHLDRIQIAYLPSLGRVRIRLSTHGNSDNSISFINRLTEELVSGLGKVVYGVDETSLSQALMALCNEKKLTISTAESCSGGYIAYSITSDSGSSSYYLGSVVSYTNELKNKILGVSHKTLERYGAVSEQTVIEMATGALKVLNSDITISVSGIAGPTGGTPEKPVGTIWMCVANKEHHYAFKINASKDRLKNIEYTGIKALNALRLFILEHY